MTITGEMENEYLFFGGQKCPYCKSLDISSDDLESDGSIAWAYVYCNDCGKKWRDDYKLVGIESVED